MSKRRRLWFRIHMVFVAVLLVSSTSLYAAEIDFLRDVEPILKRNCFRCHAGENVEAGLRLDLADAIFGAADSDESIVVPGKAGESLLLARIADEEYGDIMPLDGEPLSAKDIALLRRWIQAGAEVPSDWSAEDHWAYEAPALPVLPNSPAMNGDRLRSPIDHFVGDRLASEGLSFSDEANPAVLARRVSLALTGLPATLEQVTTFEADPSDEAYETLVDELLASPAFGQHWARHWLDLARYADSNGFQADQIRDAWAYRDWVVNAFANDLPFDRFVIEQLAGDLLPDADISTRIATGFHRTPTCNVEAGVHPEANRVNQVFDRVNTTATVFLGSTLECAQCHDHKYDPFTQKDYYSLFAYFNNTPLEVEVTAGVSYDFVGPTMDLPMLPEQEQTLQAHRTRLAKLEKQRSQLVSERDFDRWLEKTREALSRGRAKWVTPTPSVSATGNETFDVLDDQSVLFGGTLPGSTIYRFEYDGLGDNAGQPLLGVRIDALRHKSLPGGGPGRGDAVRTNFVLNEVEATLTTGPDSDTQPLAFGKATASFEQAKYGVANAVDGDPRTGWAIAPKFKDEHWAELRTAEPIVLDDDRKLAISLDQHFGRGRVMGRVKISLLIGPPETADLTDDVVALLSQDKKLTKKQLKTMRDFYAGANPEISGLDQKIRATKAAIKKTSPPTTLVMVEDETRETFVMERGDYLAQGEAVEPGTPESLHPLDDSLPKNRLGLAQWIVDPANPLMARVTVNRFWMEIFGRGIVTTPEDFGTQAESPSHPKLLDWLAVEFQTNGWSVKELLKTIVMSSTFRQGSRVTSELLERDPENELLARGPRFRLPAETVRDNALAISGLLSDSAGGPPVMPYQPTGIWKAVGRNQPKWQAAVNGDRYRRGLYVVWKRSAPYPSFVTFDAPDRASCTVRRPRTNTPLQALVLLNDHAYAEAAVGLAARMMQESPSSDVSTIATTGYRMATAQQPSDRVVSVLIDLYASEREQLVADPDLATARVSVLPKSFRDDRLDAVELGAWFAVASTLLNLDATISLQ